MGGVVVTVAQEDFLGESLTMTRGKLLQEEGVNLERNHSHMGWPIRCSLHLECFKVILQCMCESMSMTVHDWVFPTPNWWLLSCHHCMYMWLWMGEWRCVTSRALSSPFYVPSVCLHSNYPLQWQQFAPSPSEGRTKGKKNEIQVQGHKASVFQSQKLLFPH